MKWGSSYRSLLNANEKSPDVGFGCWVCSIKRINKKKTQIPSDIGHWQRNESRTLATVKLCIQAHVFKAIFKITKCVFKKNKLFN